VPDDEEFQARRDRLIDNEIANVVSDPRVLATMKKIPRHEFVPLEWREQSYENRPLPLGEDQTISQPLIVALMTELLEVRGSDRVLEIGTGSGYQTAILADLAREVYTIERDPLLADIAEKALKRLAVSNVHFTVGDGTRGWKEFEPFDAIMVTAAASLVPRDLVHQLAIGGRMVIPLGDDDQELILIRKTKDGITTKECGSVRFVPLHGKAEEQ